MQAEPTVFVVDDDQAMREGFRILLKSVGLNMETYATAQEFLDTYDPARPGCLVLDVRMPGMSGIELQEKLAAEQISIPVIIITGHADVSMVVRAMKAGAIDFIEKPFRDQALLDLIHQAIEQDARTRQHQTEKADITAGLASLTPRERQVLDLVVAGKPNKTIALALDLSHKTVEFHRAKVMEKMRAQCVADLVRMTLAATTD